MERSTCEYHRLQLGSSRTHLMKCRVLNKLFQVSDMHWALCSSPAANCLGPKLLSQDPLPVGETEKRERSSLHLGYLAPEWWLCGQVSKLFHLRTHDEGILSLNTPHCVFHTLLTQDMFDWFLRFITSLWLRPGVEPCPRLDPVQSAPFSKASIIQEP